MADTQEPSGEGSKNDAKSSWVSLLFDIVSRHAKEVVGGLFIIEADSRDEALQLAAMHPAAQIGEEGGWAVELIPMPFYLPG